MAAWLAGILTNVSFVVTHTASSIVVLDIGSILQAGIWCYASLHDCMRISNTRIQRDIFMSTVGGDIQDANGRS